MMQLDAKILPPKMTVKQVGIMKALIRRNPDGTLLDVMQLIDEVSREQPEEPCCAAFGISPRMVWFARRSSLPAASDHSAHSVQPPRVTPFSDP